MADRPQPPAPDRYYIDSQTIVAGTPFTGGVSVTAGGSKPINQSLALPLKKATKSQMLIYYCSGADSGTIQRWVHH